MMDTPSSTPASAPSGRLARQPLYQQMMAALGDRIERGDLSPGSAAPSESELIAEFQVSSTTARRCLNELAQRGLVRRIQGKGTFVSDRPLVRATPQIGILYHDLINLTDSFSANVLRGLNEVITQTPFQPALMQIGEIASSADPAAALADIVRRHELRALLLMSPIPPAWLAAVLDAGVPVAAVNFTYDDDRIHCAQVDITPGIARLTNRIVDGGHRRVAVLRGVFSEKLIEGVGMSKVELPERQGLHWTLHTFPYFKPGEVARIITEQLARKDHPTAFLCYSYEAVLEAAAVVRDRGWSIPGDASLVFMGVPSGPTQFTGEVVPVGEITARAARALLDRLAGRDAGPRVVRIDSIPHAGSTLAPLADREPDGTLRGRA